MMHLKSHARSVLTGFFVVIACVCLPFTSVSQADNKRIITGAERLSFYLPYLDGKKVGIFSNHTSVVGDTHLVDTLLRRGVSISKIFAPEHGFRGTADAGEKIENLTDPETGIPVISLYGKKRKPSLEDLADVDVMLFDIQDVGVRFYTYISSLQEFMESAIEHNKPLIVLDRPNPNGFYIDGPVLDKKFKSFVGMQPIPVVYGMTIGEYAQMLVGEKWLEIAPQHQNRKLQLTIVPLLNYTHQSKYELPVKPSPNLPEIQSIYLYPSTCFFEGTVLSEGRGTDKPFQIFGHPSLPKTLIAFTPTSREGAKNPKLVNKVCYGWDLSGNKQVVLKKVNNQLQLKWLLEAYKLFPEKDSFFRNNNFFNLLAGNDVLMKQIIAGVPEEDIRKSWQPELARFKEIRKKYLLYK
jgi:uncharacterized protein YbbC (DUF1343 family)